MGRATADKEATRQKEAEGKRRGTNLVSGNVAGIHARNCVVHQELGIEL
jgi:hypothetical protein